MHTLLGGEGRRVGGGRTCSIDAEEFLSANMPGNVLRSSETHLNIWYASLSVALFLNIQTKMSAHPHPHTHTHAARETTRTPLQLQSSN